MNNQITINETLSVLKKSSLCSNIVLLQLLKVLTGYKYSTRLLFSGKEQTEKIACLLETAGLICKRVQYHGGGSRKDRNKNGWANLSSGRQCRNEYAVYVGRTAHAAEMAAQAEQNIDDGEFGNLLSYPDCCNDFFNTTFSEAASIQGDLFPFVYRNTGNNNEQLPGLLNPLWYFDAGYIEYWPCSFRCEAALHDAAIGRMLLQQYLPDVAGYMDELLFSPTLYTEYSGIFVFVNAVFDADAEELKYAPDKIKYTAHTPLYSSLLSGDCLKKIQGEWWISQGGQQIQKLKYRQLCLVPFTKLELPEPDVMAQTLARLRALRIPTPRTVEIESLMLMFGHKNALRLIIPSERKEVIVRIADITQTKYFISPLRVVVNTSKSTGDNYVDYIKTTDPAAAYLVGFAKDMTEAKRCTELEAANSNNAMADLNQLLNYPQCCVDSFITRISREDWLKPYLENTPIQQRYSCYTNRLGYLFSGLALSYDYEPCSAICEKTIELGEQIANVLKSNSLSWYHQNLIKQISVPIFLHEGILVKINNCTISMTNENTTELLYSPSDFELKDYDLKTTAENSPLWDSDRMIVRGKKITIYKQEKLLTGLCQTRNDNRIFIFEEDV